MPEWLVGYVGPLAVAGLVAGLVLLGRGLVGERRAAHVSDVATSTIVSVAAGEARICGTVESAEASLSSPLQSRTCVYYRAEVDEQQGRTSRSILNEERAVSFRVRDETGVIRVLPHGARWLVPEAFDGRSGRGQCEVSDRR